MAVPLFMTGAPEYQITAEWIAPPLVIASGDAVVAEWHINVNDSGNPPGNDPIDNVVATFSLTNANFDGIPDLCLMTGVTPASTISADGSVLTCNFGTLEAGTALVVQTPAVADGPSGSTMFGTGSIGGQDADLPPIPINNPFGMDMLWGAPTAFDRWNQAFTFNDFDIEWTLFLDKGADAGPDSVSYTLDLRGTDPFKQIDVGPNPVTPAADVGCTPFGTWGISEGHPLSGEPGSPSQNAPFPATCTLTETATPNVFTLTLTGIDYSQTIVPTHDSGNNPLPVDRVAVASGSVWFRVFTDENTSVELDATHLGPYLSVTNQPAVDDTTNNSSGKVITRPGSWAAIWNRALTSSGGTEWDDTYRRAPGSDAVAQINLNMSGLTNAPTDQFGECLILDTQYVTFTGHSSARFQTGPLPDNSWDVYYYIGTNPLVTPGSATYDPNEFMCSGTGASWVLSTTPGLDLTQVKAIRSEFPFSEITADTGLRVLRANVTVKPDAPIGQDVWMWGSAEIDGVWQDPGDETRIITPTPDARYSHTTGRRDLFRVVGATPFIEKSAAQATVVPGVPVEFALTYSANAVVPPASIDGFTIVDTLPAGMSYVPGSASPEPEVDGQTLTWVFNGVVPNVAHTQTYEAVAAPGVPPGTPLTNTATASYGGTETDPVQETVVTTTNGYTTILKTPNDAQVQITNDDGVVTLPWTVTIGSFDPFPQAFTDTIDILPYNGDGRGTSFSGDYTLQPVTAPGGTVYYTTVAPGTLNDDPGHLSNGTAPGSIAGNTVGWSSVAPADMSTVTAIRVIGPALPSGGTYQFEVVLQTSGAQPRDVYWNRAQAVAEHTALRMRTSAPIALYEDTLDKELGSLTRNADGTYTAVFTISNTRLGNGPGYDLTDTLQYGDSITLLAPPVAANTAPGDGSIPVVNGWDPATEILTIADDVPIADGVTHTYTVTSLVVVDGETVTSASTDCTLEGNESGTGLLNTATLTVEEVQKEDEKCEPLPYVDHEKTLSGGPTPIGNGRYAVEYTLTVWNDGAGADVYDLDDDFQFGSSVTIEGTPTVTNTAPGGIPTLGTWDPVATQLIVVNDQPIAGATAAGRTEHVYVVRVEVSVDAPLVTFENTDCALDGTGNGTGLFNTSTLTVDEYEDNEDACPPISEPVPSKVLSSQTTVGTNEYEVQYTLRVTNAGAAASTYDLLDDMQFGQGATIVGTPTVTNTAPGGISTLGTWDSGATQVAVVNGQSIAAGQPGAPTIHEYVVTVRVSTAGGISASAADCTLAPGENGTGFFNTVRLTVNGETSTADDCGSPPPTEPPLPPTPVPTTQPQPEQLPATGSDNRMTLMIAVALLAAGGLALTITRRRRRAIPS